MLCSSKVCCAHSRALFTNVVLKALLILFVQVRVLKEERLKGEAALEVVHSKELEHRSRSDALKQDLDHQRQRHLTQVYSQPDCCLHEGQQQD